MISEGNRRWQDSISYGKAGGRSDRGDTLVFGKHRVSLVAGCIASCCVWGFIKTFPETSGVDPIWQ